MSATIYVSADAAAEMLRERGQEIADLKAQIVSMMRVWDQHDKVARATSEDLSRALQERDEAVRALRNLVDECRVHQTSPPDYAWNECICGEENGHTIDCPVAFARALLARLDGRKA